jgi:outer membrane protein
VVRLRATHVSPDVSSNLGGQTTATRPAGLTGTNVYGSESAKLEVGNNTIPELDISYYFTKNIAAELILALGTRHDVNVSGTGGALNSRSLGSVNLLPPTLTGQWHFMPDQTFDPYVGAGVAYVRAMDNGLTANTTLGYLPIRIERNTFGGVLQAGFDVNLKDKWLVNFDVKKVFVSTNVELNAGTSAGFQKIDTLDLDPWIVSVGFGKKF